jgi:hypothetical protein
MQKFNFFIQYLLAPIIIAIVGAIITFDLQKNQRHLEEMKFTEQILKDAYDTSNAARGLAICMLIKPALKENPEFADSLIESINAFYKSRLNQAAREGDVGTIRDIQSASQDIQGSSSEIAKAGKVVLGKAQVARDYELKGFENLAQGNLAEAKENFANSETAYNGYHNAYEITRLLNSAQKIIASDPENKQKVTDSVKSVIQNKYPLIKQK